MTANVEVHDGRGSGCGLLVALAILAVLAVIALAALPQEFPPLENVRLRPHAVEKHGEDAVKAREGVFNCPGGIQRNVCPPSGLRGMTICYWCETGEYLCPGMYLTGSGLEKTSFIRPCAEWKECR